MSSVSDQATGIEPLGSAACSYGVLRRASDCVSGNADITSLLSLFSVLEAAVLYRQLYYLPFGDYSGAWRKTALGEALLAAGLIRTVDNGLIEDTAPTMLRARTAWSRTVRDLGSVPVDDRTDENTALELAFRHGTRAQVWNVHLIKAETDSALALSSEGLQSLVNNLTGATDDPNSLERFNDWETFTDILARSAVAEELKLDYVSDAFEQPVALLSNRISAHNTAIRLYSTLSANLRNKVEGLREAGTPVAVTIPPIATLVLDRSDGRLETIIREVQGLREEFAEFREKYAGYAGVLSVPRGRTLGELVDTQREAVAEVEAALNHIAAQRTDSRLLSEVIGVDLTPGGDSGDALEIEPAFSLTGLLRFGLQKWKVHRIRGRARILFNVWHKTLRVRDYHSLVARKLAYAPTDAEMTAYEAYGRTLESLVAAPARS